MFDIEQLLYDTVDSSDSTFLSFIAFDVCIVVFYGMWNGFRMSNANLI